MSGLFEQGESLFLSLLFCHSVVHSTLRFLRTSSNKFLPRIARFGCTFLCVSFLASCSSPKPKKTTSKPASQTDSPKKEATGSSWQQSLGRVALVNQEMGFALVDIGTAPSPDPDTPLRSYSGPNVSGELVVSKYQKRPYLILDIVSGMPKVGDSIVVGARRPSSETGQLPKEQIPLRRYAEEPLPQSESKVEYLPNLIKAEPKVSASAPSQPRVPESVLTPRPEAPSETVFISTPQPAPSLPKAEPEPKAVLERGAAPPRSGDIIPGVPVFRQR